MSLNSQPIRSFPLHNPDPIRAEIRDVKEPIRSFNHLMRVRRILSLLIRGFLAFVSEGELEQRGLGSGR